MKKKLFLIAISFMFPFFSQGGNYYELHTELVNNPCKPPFATHVYFSNVVPVNGLATESKSFDIKPGGGFAYLIVDNYPNNFTYDKLKVKVYKTVNGAYQNFDSKTYSISTGSYYTYIKYDFYSIGNYTFDVFDKNGAVLGTAVVDIYNQASTGSQGNSGDCGREYKEYYNPSLGFAMCVPKKSYAVENQAGKDEITFNDFFGQILSISFMQEPPEGIDRFDASVIDIAASLAKSYNYASYYRKEFKFLSSKTDISIYRSVTNALKNTGDLYESSVFYVRMSGRKIRGYDYMVISGPFVANADDILYQTIIEFGMLAKLKIY